MALEHWKCFLTMSHAWLWGALTCRFAVTMGLIVSRTPVLCWMGLCVCAWACACSGVLVCKQGVRAPICNVPQTWNMMAAAFQSFQPQSQNVTRDVTPTRRRFHSVPGNIFRQECQKQRALRFQKKTSSASQELPFSETDRTFSCVCVCVSRGRARVWLHSGGQPLWSLTTWTSNNRELSNDRMNRRCQS